MQFDTSKAQRKALDVLGIQYDPRISREYAAELLTKVGVSGDGVPAGHTWRSAAKLSDEELQRALVTPEWFGRKEVYALSLGEMIENCPECGLRLRVSAESRNEYGLVDTYIGICKEHGIVASAREYGPECSGAE